MSVHSWRNGIAVRGALLFIIIMVLLLLAGRAMLQTARATTVGQAQAQVEHPHLVIQQTPRLQEIFVGNNASFTVTIVNTGDVRLEQVKITNSVATACNQGNAGPLEPEAQTTYSCQVNNINESFLNVITAEGTAAGAQETTITRQSDAFVKVLRPEIRILKRPSSQTITRGATARFTIALLNPSNDDVLVDVTVADSVVPGCAFNPPIPFNLGPGDDFVYNCNIPNVQSAFTSIATVTANVLGSDATVSARDAAWVELLDLQASLNGVPASLSEPGGLVTFTIVVNNLGTVPVTLQSLDTNRFGNVMLASNPLVVAGENSCVPSSSPPMLPPQGGGFTCSFLAEVAAQPSDYSVILTAVAEASSEQEVSATTNTTISVTDLPSSLSVSVTADPPLIPAPGGTIAYAVRLLNRSEADVVTINTLQDSILGDLNGVGTCELPTAPLAPAGSYQCQFTDVVSGAAGTDVTRLITAGGFDDDLTPNPVSANDEISVGISEREIERVFLAAVADDADEPNNTCTQAYPLPLNRQFHFLAEDVQDVYSFTLRELRTIRVELTNFVPLAGQLVVWTGECGALELVGRNPDTALTKTVNLGTQPPGFYIIQIINDGPMDTGERYGLIVHAATIP